jgi:hypothetical protein
MLVADGMGLGKTRTSLMLARAHQMSYNILVLYPVRARGVCVLCIVDSLSYLVVLKLIYFLYVCACARVYMMHVCIYEYTCKKYIHVYVCVCVWVCVCMCVCVSVFVCVCVCVCV